MQEGLVFLAADNRKPQSFVKYGNRRANRKLSVPCRENLQISYPNPRVLPSCHYNRWNRGVEGNGKVAVPPLRTFENSHLLFNAGFRVRTGEPAGSWIRVSEHLISTQFRWLESTYKPTNPPLPRKELSITEAPRPIRISCPDYLSTDNVYEGFKRARQPISCNRR